MPQKTRKVVLGLGNLLFSDEGVGIHAVQYLRSRLEEQFPAEWVDGGVMGLNLLPLVEDCNHLLVLDALDAGRLAGTVVEMTGEEIPLYSGMKMSEHQVSFQEVLSLAKFRGTFPISLHFIGIQPACLSPGLELSEVVKAAFPTVAQRAEKILNRWCEKV